MRASLNTTIQPGSETAIYNNFVTIKNSKKKPQQQHFAVDKKSCSDNTVSDCDDDIFRKYTIIEKYGSGSMGAIYKVKLNPDYTSTILKQHYRIPATEGRRKRGLFSSLKKTFTVSKSKEQQEHQQQYEEYWKQQQQRLTQSLPPSITNETTTAPGAVENGSKKENDDDSNDNIYALKSIILDRISAEFIEELKNEISILQRLDHPNIVKAYEVYTIPQQTIYLIMECCTGGDLYTRQKPPMLYTERMAANLTSQILSAVCYMHDHGIVHRDLKYENILFESKDLSNTTIKIIDFGLSKKFKTTVVGHNNTPLNHQLMYERVGTIYTMSPQVIQGIYTSQADLWSIGVICYMLLSNTKPFYHPKSRERMIALIMEGKVSFTNTPIWDHISEDAKNFVSQLLLIDPDRRLHASSALQHRWIKHREVLPNELPSKEVLEAIDDSFVNYCTNTNQLKKIALTVIAHRSNAKDILELRKVFDSIDTEKDGIITMREFKDALLSMNFPSKDITSVFSAIDLNHNGKINYTEFLAATIEMYGNIEEDRILEAFDRIDTDEDGYISRKNLQDALGKDFTKEKVDEIMRVSDLDRDGKISYAEFLAAFRIQTSQAMLKTLDRS